MKKFYIAALLLILLLSGLLFGYGLYLNVIHDSHMSRVMGQVEIELSGGKAKKMEITPEILLEEIGLGTLNMTDVRTKIDGTVKEILVVKGQKVKKGQPLCRIENDELSFQIARAATEIAKAESAYIKTKSDYKRNKKLVETDIVSQSEFETSRVRMEAAAAELRSSKIMKEQLEKKIQHTELKAPIDGIIMSIYSSSGNRIASGAAIMNIADFSVMTFAGLLSEEKVQNLMPLDADYTCEIDASQVRQRVFDVALDKGVSRANRFDIRILGITPPLDQKTTLLRNLSWEVKNPHGIIEIGMYTNVIIRKKEPVKVLALPLAAIRNRNGKGVYCVDEQGKLLFKPVKTGYYDDNSIEIKSGITSRDTVVFSAVEDLPLGTKVQITEQD